MSPHWSDFSSKGLNNIKWLRLSHNSLNNLAPEAFAGLFTLSRLSLDHNELQFFPTQTMNRWDNLGKYYKLQCKCLAYIAL